MTHCGRRPRPTGVFDPTIAAALEAAGYDRTFCETRPELRPAKQCRPGAGARSSWSAFLVRRPVGLRLDLNGVVKGRAVDDALALLEGDGFVSAGGDLATRGEIVVALPGGDTVTAPHGALATSGVTTRRWERSNGPPAHHLIDPTTGAPRGCTLGMRDRLRGHLPRRGRRGQVGVPARRRRAGWLDAAGLQGRFSRTSEIVLAGGWPESSEAAVHLAARHTIWYAARAGGVVAYLLVSAA